VLPQEKSPVPVLVQPVAEPQPLLAEELERVPELAQQLRPGPKRHHHLTPSFFLRRYLPRLLCPLPLPRRLQRLFWWRNRELGQMLRRTAKLWSTSWENSFTAITRNLGS
jgi:hypothetical protein